MKLATRNLLADLVVEALEDRITATAIHCLTLVYRADTQTSTSLTVEQLLKPASAPEREAARDKLRAHPLLSWDFSNSSGQVTLADAFLDEQPEIAAKLARFSTMLHQWSPDKSAPPIQQTLKKGVLLFNHHLFFEVHEVLEAQWVKETGEEKRFLQGLIQIAVAFYHCERGNLRGALLLLQEGSEKIAPHQPAFLGVELQEFLQQVAFCRAELMRLRGNETVQFREEEIPRLRFVS